MSESDPRLAPPMTTAATRPRIAILGASGVIGRALSQHLADDYDLTSIGPASDGTDVRLYPALPPVLAGHDVVIHLAWQYVGWGMRPNENPDLTHYDNLLMTRNALKASKEAGVKRMIMASSIHADYMYDWTGPRLMTVDDAPRGNGPYGASKLMVEEFCKEFADESLSVAAIRYGGVTPDGSPHPTDPWERRVWLSYRDLASLIRLIVEADELPTFSLMYAVSDNVGRVHDVANPFGWSPVDSAPALPSEATLSP